MSNRERMLPAPSSVERSCRSHPTTNSDPPSQHPTALSNPIDIATLEEALLKEEAEMKLKTASLEAALKAEAEASATRKQELALQLRRAKEAAQRESSSGNGLVDHVAIQARFHALLAQCLEKATVGNVNTLIRSWNLEMERYLERIDRDGVDKAPLALSYHEDLAVFGEGSVKTAQTFSIEQLGELAKEWPFNMPPNSKADEDPREHYGYTAEQLNDSSHTSNGLRRQHAAQIVAAGAKRTQTVPVQPHMTGVENRDTATKTVEYCSRCHNSALRMPFAACFWKQVRVKKDGTWVAQWDNGENACANCVHDGVACERTVPFRSLKTRFMRP